MLRYHFMTLAFVIAIVGVVIAIDMDDTIVKTIGIVLGFVTGFILISIDFTVRKSEPTKRKYI